MSYHTFFPIGFACPSTSHYPVEKTEMGFRVCHYSGNARKTYGKADYVVLVDRKLNTKEKEQVLRPYSVVAKNPIVIDGVKKETILELADNMRQDGQWHRAEFNIQKIGHKIVDHFSYLSNRD